MLFCRVKSIVTDNHYLLIASNLMLTYAVTYFHNLFFSDSFRVIFNYFRTKILFHCLCLTSEMHSFLLQAEFHDNHKCNLKTWQFWKASAEFHYTQAPSVRACTTCGSPQKPSSSALNNLGSALLSISFADGNSLCHVRGKGNFLADCPYVQA